MAASDIKYFTKATAYLEGDLSDKIIPSPINKIIHKMVIDKMMNHKDEFHPYERLGLSGRDEFRTLLTALYPTVGEQIVKTNFKLCNRKVIGQLCGEKISCNHCRVAID